MAHVETGRAHRDSSNCACSACGARVTPLRGSRLWWVPTIASFFVFAFAGSLSAVIPPLNLVLVPVVFLAGAQAVGFFSRKVTGDQHCPACGKFYVPVSAQSAPELPGGLPRPSDERAMKRALV